MSSIGTVTASGGGYIVLHTKAESQWLAGEDRRAAVATSGSTMSRRIPMLYCTEVTEWRNGPFGLRDDHDDD